VDKSAVALGTIILPKYSVTGEHIDTMADDQPRSHPQLPAAWNVFA
jgi:hypothetical protein